MENSETEVVITNLLLMIAWHLGVLVVCKKLNASFFDARKFLYSPKKWEQEGKFYTKVLKIKKWKDKLPQYVAKNGFSKRSLNFKMIDKDYLETFIVETCRAEWNHLMGCMYWIVSIFVNSSLYAFVFSLIPIFANLPFIMIQRFNRIRLCKWVKRKYSRSAIIYDSKVS